MYYFTKDNGRIGSWHSGEEVYLYGNIPPSSKLYTEEDRSLSDQFLHYVKNYVTNGDPNGEGLPRWEPVTDGTEVLELNVPIQKTQTPYLELFEILDDYYHYQ